jgi:hypothetical protein
MTLRRCLICNRLQDDYVHGPERSGPHDVKPLIESHDFDAGERRRQARRDDDALERRSGRDRRHEIRRMDDRVRAIEAAL